MALTAKPVLLLVEDSIAMADLLRKKFEAGFEVKCAHDGEEALRIIKSGGPIAAAVVDLLLPKVDGFEVIRVLRGMDHRVPVVVITARPRHDVEKDVNALGTNGLLIKPFEFSALDKMVQDAIAAQKRQESGEAAINPATGKKLPFRVSRKCCYICGYEKVQTFIPIPGSFTESWSRGAYPIYTSKTGYDPWDFLRNLVFVCPYCFFASSDPADFAPTRDSPYPFSEESKKILARSITVRKRLIPDARDVDTRFDSPFRTRELVSHSLQLANKCCNGLILAGKMGSYAQAGLYCTFLGAMAHPGGESWYKEAFNSFGNQLKVKDTPPGILVRTYYFSIVLNMLLSRTAQGRVIMQKISSIYQDKQMEDLSQEERDWLMRVDYTWKNGIDYTNPREIG